MSELVGQTRVTYGYIYIPRSHIAIVFIHTIAWRKLHGLLRV